MYRLTHTDRHTDTHTNRHRDTHTLMYRLTHQQTERQFWHMSDI